jgi:anti-sigma factor RsiW
MATHGSYLRWISADLDDELGEREQGLLREHLERCPDCSREREQVHRLSRSVRDVAATPVPAGLQERILDAAWSATARILPLPRSPVLRVARRSAAAAAAILLLLGAFHVSRLPDQALADPVPGPSAADQFRPEPEFVRWMTVQSPEWMAELEYLNFFCPGNGGARRR